MGSWDDLPYRSEFDIKQKNFIIRTLLGLREYRKIHPDRILLEYSNARPSVDDVITKLERFLSVLWYNEGDRNWLNNELPKIAKFVHPYAIKRLREEEAKGMKAGS